MNTTYICRKVDGEQVNELTAAGAIAKAILIALDNGDCTPLFYQGRQYSFAVMGRELSFNWAIRKLQRGEPITVDGRFLVQVCKVGGG